MRARSENPIAVTRFLCRGEAKWRGEREGERGVLFGFRFFAVLPLEPVQNREMCQFE
jgi:hypothetical protein